MLGGGGGAVHFLILIIFEVFRKMNIFRGYDAIVYIFAVITKLAYFGGGRGLFIYILGLFLKVKVQLYNILGAKFSNKCLAILSIPDILLGEQ